MKKRKYRLLIAIVIIFIIILAVCLHIRYDYKYEAAYKNRTVFFVGELVGIWSLEYSEINILPNTSDFVNNIKIHIKNNFINVNELTPDIMRKLGAEVEGDDNLVRVIIEPPLGHNPPYQLICQFKGKELLSVSFWIANPPDSIMGPLGDCPIQFSFGDSGKISFPITKKRLMEIMGKPDEVNRYLKFP